MTVLQLSLDLLDFAVLGLVILVSLSIVVVSKLALPGKLVHRLHILLLQLLNDVSSVHISGDKSNQYMTIEWVQLRVSDEVGQFENLLLILLQLGLQGRDVPLHLLDCNLSIGSPHDLSDGSDNLSWLILHDPCLTWLVFVRLVAVAECLG